MRQSKNFDEIVTNLELNQSKLTNLQDLSNLSLNTSQSFNLVSDDSEIIENHEILLNCLKKQSEVCISVAENIAHKVNNFVFIVVNNLSKNQFRKVIQQVILQIRKELLTKSIKKLSI